MILWADVESTGLSEYTDRLLEVALLATTDQLVPVDNGINVVIIHDLKRPDTVMAAEVLDMHERSGLLSEVAESQHTISAATDTLLEYLSQFDSQNLAQTPLAGSNIKFDRRWLHHFMPSIVEPLHYRDICVSTVKEMTRRFFPSVYDTAPAKSHEHRALPDIHESIAEFRHYLCGLRTLAPL